MKPLPLANIARIRDDYQSRTGGADDYSIGPFSPVFFFLDAAFRLETYTYRNERLRVKPSQSLVNTLFFSLSNFNQVYVATDLLPPTS